MRFVKISNTRTFLILLLGAAALFGVYAITETED